MRSGVFLLPLLVVQIAWLLAPGLAIGLTLLRRGLIAAHYVVPVAGLVGCLLGYVAFWIYLADLRAGRAYSVVTIVVSAAAVALLVARRRNRLLMRSADVAGPLLLLYLVACFYTSVTMGCSVSAAVVEVNQFCHLHNVTGDNVLPQIFADNVLRGTPREMTWGWQGSDRPPLQSGAVLLQTPLTNAAGWHITGYLTLATVLQVLWVPGIWALCRSLRLSRRRLAVVTALCVFSGFFLFNSVFTWPKLLAASIAITAFGLLAFEDASPWTWGLAGLALGTAMMAHPGVAFTLAAAVAVMLLSRYRPGWTPVLLAACGVVLVAAPWTAYQKLYDPPGDRLLQLHLAGTIEDRPAAELVRDKYLNTPATTILGNKLNNLGTVVGIPNHPASGGSFLALVRDEQLRYVAISLGLLNLGWLALFARSTRRRLGEVLDASRLKQMLLVAAGALLLWVLIMFGPPHAITIVHQGSYATMMLLFCACAAMVTALSRPVVRALVATQVVFFGAVWVLAIWRHHHPHWLYVGLSAVSAAALMVFLRFSDRWIPDAREEPGDDDERDGGRPVPRPDDRLAPTPG